MFHYNWQIAHNAVNFTYLTPTGCLDHFSGNTIKSFYYATAKGKELIAMAVAAETGTVTVAN